LEIRVPCTTQILRCAQNDKWRSEDLRYAKTGGQKKRAGTRPAPTYKMEIRDWRLGIRPAGLAERVGVDFWRGGG